jgi:hypothetical protein
METKKTLKAYIAKSAILTDKQFDYFFVHFKKHCFQKRQVIITVDDHIQYFFRWGTNKGFFAGQKMLLSLMNNDVKHRHEELLKLYLKLFNIVPTRPTAASLVFRAKRYAGYTTPGK